MARNVFFSFSWKDIFLVNQIRQADHIYGINIIGFKDKVEIEQAKKQTDQAIKNWIDTQMQGCTCLIVLCGNNTGESKWVKYEIELANQKGIGRFLIRMDGMSMNHGNDGYNESCISSQDPYEYNNLYAKDNNPNNYTIKQYIWKKIDNPYSKIGSWIEDSCERAGR